MNILKSTIFLSLVILFTILSCEKNDDFSLNPGEQSIIGVLESGGQIQAMNTFQNNSVNAIDSLMSGEMWLCNHNTVSIGQNFSEYYNYSPNSEILVPGVLLQGNTIQQATPEPVPLRRGAGVVYIDLWNGSSMVRKELPEASPSLTMEAINEILAEQSGIIPASFSTSKEYMYAKEQLELELKANASILGAFKVKVYTNWEDDEEYSRMLVTLDEIYYTMIFERPSSPEEFFHSDVKAEKLAQFTGPGNPLVYISSVTVGRKFYLLIETTEEKSELEVAVGASFFGNGGDISVKTVDQLSGLNIEAYALGGDREAAIAAVYNGPDALQTFLETGASIDNGRPISYVLRSVLTDEVVKNGIATEYDYTECEPITPVESDPILWYIANENNYEFVYSPLPSQATWKVEQWKDLSGNNNHGTTSTNGFCGLNEDEPDCSERGFKLVKSLSPGVSELNFDATKLVDSDYTITLAMNNSLSVNCSEIGQNYWSIIYGANPELGKLINISFKGSNKINFSHNIAGSPALQAYLPSSTCSVLSFVFSKTEGTSIAIDGEIVATDPQATEPLTSFIGAKMGVFSHLFGSGSNIDCAWNSLLIYEVVAHNQALSSNQIHSLHDQITNRHDL